VADPDLLLTILRTEYSEDLRRTQSDAAQVGTEAEIVRSRDLAFVDEKIERVNSDRIKAGKAAIPKGINAAEMAKRASLQNLIAHISGFIAGQFIPLRDSIFLGWSVSDEAIAQTKCARARAIAARTIKQIQKAVKQEAKARAEVSKLTRLQLDLSRPVSEF
jgi:hypothetical protein